MRRPLFFPAALLAAAVAVPGCSETGLTTYDVVDVWRQNPPDEVDILMVVDNSCSMAPYQEQLGGKFDQFISWFIEADVDYQVGVVTTDAGSTNPNAGGIVGEVITPDTANPAATFNQIVNVGVAGSGFEQGLEAAKMALTDVKTEANVEFLRDDASLSIIFVSDEEDASPLGVNDYINTFFDIKGARNRDVFNASALAAVDMQACLTNPETQQSTAGTRYADVALQTGGVVGDLCLLLNDDQGFEDIVFDLSLASSRLASTYFLSQDPQMSTLKVFVDDDEVPCTDGSWTYDRILNEQTGEIEPAILFATDRLPTVGAQITARYFGGGGAVEDFCQTDDGGAE